jgi:hypothetical protein
MQASDQQIQMPVGQMIVERAREGTWERAGQTDDQHANIPKCDIRPQGAVRMGGVNQKLDWRGSSIPCLNQIRIFWRDLADQRGHDGADAQVERAVHVTCERLKAVRLLGQRRAGFLGHAAKHVKRYRAQQRRTIDKPSIQCANAYPSARCNRFEWRVSALIGEDITGRC